MSNHISTNQASDSFSNGLTTNLPINRDGDITSSFSDISYYRSEPENSHSNLINLSTRLLDIIVTALNTSESFEQFLMNLDITAISDADKADLYKFLKKDILADAKNIINSRKSLY